MKLYAATTQLEIGDSVKLDYTIIPANAQAVIGYFCDEENIIDISAGGVITATGEGTATVVVCANDEIYKQCDFCVTEASTEVTRQTPKEANTVPSTDKSVNKTKMQVLNEIGINTDKLLAHKDYYIIPITLIASTGFLVCMITIIKRISEAIRSKKDAPEE